MLLALLLLSVFLIWVNWITREVPRIDPGPTAAEQMKALRDSVGHAEYDAWFRENFGNMPMPRR